MKSINIAVFSLFVMLVGSANSAASVSEIIQLCEAGLSPDLIMAVAKKQAPVDLTTQQMLDLKKVCGGDEVIRALMGQSAGAVASIPNSPGHVDNRGLYLVSNGQLKEIQPVFLRRAGFQKGLKGFGSLVKMAPKMKAELPGSEAIVRAGRQPEFVVSGIDKSFLLVRLDQKNGKREAIVGSGGLMGVQGRFEEKSLVAFDLDRKAGRITFGRPLEPGQYVFYPADGFRASGEANLELTGQGYDFTVD